MKSILAFLFILALSISACNTLSRTPTAVALADSFFSGYAFVDANGNGQIDPADTPLKNAIFIVQLEGGAQFGALTDETGNAFVTIPAAVRYPVTLFMRPSKDSALVLVSPPSIIQVKATGDKATFLFTSK